MKERKKNKKKNLWLCFLNPTGLQLLPVDNEANKKLSVLIRKGKIQRPGFILQILTMQQQETP